MLGHLDAHPVIAVRDLAAAERFYRDVLGLKLVGRHGNDAVSFGSGTTVIDLRRGEPAPASQAVLVWPVVDGLDELVQRLQQAGVSVARDDVTGRARFEDPDGNGLELIAAAANPTA